MNQLNRNTDRCFRATLPNGQKVRIATAQTCNSANSVRLAAQGERLAALLRSEANESALVRFLEDVCPATEISKLVETGAPLRKMRHGRIAAEGSDVPSSVWFQLPHAAPTLRVCPCRQDRAKVRGGKEGKEDGTVRSVITRPHFFVRQNCATQRTRTGFPLHSHPARC